MFGPPQKPWLWTAKTSTSSAMFEMGTAAKCCEFKQHALRLDSMLRELLSCDKHGCFSWENALGPSQKPWLWTEKETEGTSSAMFGLATDAKCCELKRCADRVRSRTQGSESPQRQITVRNLNVSPSTFTV